MTGMCLTPGYPTPAPTGAARAEQAGLRWGPPSLCSSRGAEHSRIWETHLVPHSLEGKKKGAVSGRAGVPDPVGRDHRPWDMSLQAWLPHAARALLPARDRSPWRSRCHGHTAPSGGHWARRASTQEGWSQARVFPAQALRLWGQGGCGRCSPHSRTQTLVCVLKRVCPSGQKQPSASPLPAALWLLQGDKGIPGTPDP